MVECHPLVLLPHRPLCRSTHYCACALLYANVLEHLKLHVMDSKKKNKKKKKVVKPSQSSTNATVAKSITPTMVSVSYDIT